MSDDRGEKGSRYRRRWQTAAAVVALALLLYGLRLYADPAAKPADKAPKAEPAKAAPPPAPENLLQHQMDGAFEMMQGMMQILQKNQGAGPNPGDLHGLMNQMMRIQQKQMQEMLKMKLPDLPPLPALPGFDGAGEPDNRAEAAQFQRLGVEVRGPYKELAEQLDLPNGQGLVLTDVGPESAAAKAGLRAADILLELDGKPVSRDPAAFAKALEEIKANKPVAVVLLRKGKKTDLKGLSLPETPALPPVPAAQPGGLPGFGAFPRGQGNFPQLPVPPVPGAGLGRGGFGPGARLGGHQSLGQPGGLRAGLGGNGDFTASYQEGPLSVDVSGTTNNGIATPSEIVIKDGATTLRFGNLEQVPDAYRDKVKVLLGKSGKR